MRADRLAADDGGNALCVGHPRVDAVVFAPRAAIAKARIDQAPNIADNLPCALLQKILDLRRAALNWSRGGIAGKRLCCAPHLGAVFQFDGKRPFRVVNSLEQHKMAGCTRIRRHHWEITRCDRWPPT
jgi:hypothetical protein